MKISAASAVIAQALALLLASSSARADTVSIVFGQSLAPFANEQTGEGLEIEIIRAALTAAGHEMRLQFVPQARVPIVLKAAQCDGAATLTADSGVPAAYSEVYIHYQDYVIARKGRYTSPLHLADLKNARIVGFQNAALYLGPEFAALVKGNPRYVENANQLSQVRMLFDGQADAIVAEHHIFHYQIARLRSSRFREQPFEVDYFPLFEKIPYRVAFREARLRDDFNAGLAKIRANGQLQRIEAVYTGP